VMEFEGEGEANDAGPGDADVRIRKDRVMHGISLVRLRRGYSLGVPVCGLAAGESGAWLCGTKDGSCGPGAVEQEQGCKPRTGTRRVK
jgi:hypothetical protein